MYFVVGVAEDDAESPDRAAMEIACHFAAKFGCLPQSTACNLSPFEGWYPPIEGQIMASTV